eukprot:TRINITY_DN32507_c0_g1_i1.p1 TRINITY_DN32507_c0_g1~~TRINITY_DN32507_c0_g1_i1.p1  ORF type:complete len:651 (-),score=125.39 TRINITY_DN32507_c0_g1_i1:123-2075(-)
MSLRTSDAFENALVQIRQTYIEEAREWQTMQVRLQEEICRLKGSSELASNTDIFLTLPEAPQSDLLSTSDLKHHKAAEDCVIPKQSEHGHFDVTESNTDVDKCEISHVHCNDTGSFAIVPNGPKAAVERTTSRSSNRRSFSRSSPAKTSERRKEARVRTRKTGSGGNRLKIKDELKKHAERGNSVLGVRRVDFDDQCTFRCCILSPIFDSVTALMILFNSCIVGLEIEWNTSHTEVSPVLFAFSRVCNAFFFTELLLRIAGMKWDFIFDKDSRFWNIFDSVLVVLIILEEAIDLSSGWQDPLESPGSSSNPEWGAVKMIKMLRIFRLFRVFRLLRPLSKLAIMMMDASKTLMWAMVMLGLIMYVFAIVLTSQASDWVTKNVETSEEHWHILLAESDDPVISVIFFRFGSLGKTVYTLILCILGGISWHQVSDPLFEVGSFSVVLLILYVSFTVLAVLIVHCRCCHLWQEYSRQLEEFFEAIDEDSSGDITPEELTMFLSDPVMSAYFSVLGFDIHDARRFVDLLDTDHSGSVTFDEFYEGCMLFRGFATGVDVHTLLRQSEELMGKIDNIFDWIDEHREDLMKWIKDTRRDEELALVGIAERPLDKADGETNGLLSESSKKNMSANSLQAQAENSSRGVDFSPHDGRVSL